ncbi:hypothetical protein KVR01_000880 [Diaporthe batatas]|uniref:uncharacterized protein n=1 Tax=Diaporthe batatas TaxID=748121 RepID=UPI001D059099|nr:uncharacterized protein KVR01_000880 [Diaporthe batatas]KAG8170135.1 hypothetical protein KVR01_000880 [Diaporthe batatas]
MPPPGQASSKREIALSWREEDIIAAWEQTPRVRPSGYGVTGFAFPPQLEQPIAYVKVGSQAALQPELRNQEYVWKALNDMPPDQTRGIRTPCVYRTFQSGHWFYIVMEYIPGKTLQQLMDQKDWSDPQRAARTNSIARAMRLLMSIPVPAGQTPGPVGGGRIRHSLFRDDISYCVYSSVDELEKHLNDASTIRFKTSPTVNLEKSLCFYYSDFYASNFIFTDSGDVAIIDFDQAGFLPPSFMSYALAESHWVPGIWVSDVLKLPDHNLAAMRHIHYYFMIGGSSFGLPRRPKNDRTQLEGWTIQAYRQHCESFQGN